MTAIKENNLGHAIHHQDVTLLGNEKVVQINLKHSKTDQLGKGAVVNIENDQMNTMLKPIEVLQAYMRVRPPSQRLFILPFWGETSDKISVHSSIK